ncbi:unnamed protein product [Rotaria sp. Silwood1]|nr:unnamed protein product [Rotaria sp. Silwood1]
MATVHPHRSISFLPFVASGKNLFLLNIFIRISNLGSGGYTSLSVIEDHETKQLIRDALYASTITDLFSGSKINMYVLTKEKLDKFLSYEIIAVRTEN